MNAKLILGLVAVFCLMGLAVAQPNGEYGDAPDNETAYPGVMGRFPVLYDSSSGLMGGHTIVVGQEMIGTTASPETDADDPADPDGTENLVDEDLDDPIYTLILPVSIPAQARFGFEVTVADGAPEADRYINALVDFDKNGSWGDERNGKEWVVKNQVVNVPPGTTQDVATEWFLWGKGMIMPTPVWARITITTEPVDGNDWKGDGEFRSGEVQDFIVEIQVPGNKTKKPWCGNNIREGAEKCDGGDDAACPGKCRADCTCPKPPGDDDDDDDGKKKPPGGPGPRRGPCTTPIAYHALVINAGDNKRRRQGQDSADDIWSMLGEQGYDSGQYLAPHWDKDMGEMPDNGVTEGGYSSLADIEAAIAKLGKNVKCVDRVMIYIIGHGMKKGGTKYGKSWPSGGIILQGKNGGKEVLTPEQLDEWLDKYLPACPGEDCRTPKKSCHVSIVVESCHSGNFFDAMKGTGRTVATSCSSAEVARFGVDDDGNSHGGDYSNGYVKDMYSPDTADTDKDGYVSVGEAHASAKAKLSVAKKGGGTQTPQFDSDECECEPLSCAGKCGDGVIDESNNEDCDYNATPTGCPDDQECNKECYCEETYTECVLDEILSDNEVCDPTASPTGCATGETCNQECECESDDSVVCDPQEGFYTYISECNVDCDTTCVMNDFGCYYCPETDDACPTNQYTADECEAKRNERQVCTLSESTGCYFLQTLCNSGEYLDSECEDECDADEACFVSDADVPCYTCGAQDCDEGEFEDQSACDTDCAGDCLLNEGTNCWYCSEEVCSGQYDNDDCDGDCDQDETCEFDDGTDCWDCEEIETPQTCEDQGKYTTQGACEADCDGADFCEFQESSDCWRCVGVTCPGGWTEGGCPTCGSGQVCAQHPDGYECYICEDVPDCGSYCEGEGYSTVVAADESKSYCSSHYQDDFGDPPVCFTTCYYWKFMSWTKASGNVYTCCCAQEYQEECTDCPGANPSCPDCPPSWPI